MTVRATRRTSSRGGLTYKNAGVDIRGADAFVHNVFKLAQHTYRNGVVTHPLGYSGLFRPELNRLRDPLIAATCDGVGTKLRLAQQMRWYEGLGQDLVAMSVNDLLPVGAQPLFFLDYIAVGQLRRPVMDQILKGIAKACAEVGCALLGGETAEMPGVYKKDDFDLAGFAVGLADGSNLPKHNSIAPGDLVLARASSGVHSNGFSLVRRVLQKARVSLTHRPKGWKYNLGRTLLTPTFLYCDAVLHAWRSAGFKAAAHITGGGLLGRAQKLLRRDLDMFIDPTCYVRPPVFDFLFERGHLSEAEMAKTFNMGLGFLVVADRRQAKAILQQPGWLKVGEISRGRGRVDLGYAQG